MTRPAPSQPGDRIALVHTDDPDTRLRPGDQGTVIWWDPAQGQLHIRWDSGSTLSMLPGEGDQVRLLARANGQDGTEPEDPLVTRAGELGRDAGRAAATWVFDGGTPEEAYQRVLRGIDEGDPRRLGCDRAARDRPGRRVRRGRPRPRPRHRTGRSCPAPDRVGLRRRLHRQLLAGNRADRPRAHRLKPGTASTARPGEKHRQAAENPHRKECGNKQIPRGDKTREVSRGSSR